MNLYELIKKNSFQGFSLPLIRRFAHALLLCLQLLQQERVIHCDLKPVSALVGGCGCGFTPPPTPRRISCSSSRARATSK